MPIQTVEDSYTAYGNISRLFTLKDPEIMLAGPAGTGKSRGNLEYLNYWASEYPRCRLLLLRKTRRSLTESGMVTLAQKVLNPAQGVRFMSSMQQYQYPNGSIIAVGGLDKASKIMSSEWDIIMAQEGTELTQDDWEMCGLRVRNGKLPVQQLIGDCNPGPHTHWLKQRAQAGGLLMMDTKHEDNPVLFSRNGQMTAEGKRYIGKLDQLTGVRLARYRYGLWVSSEGMVYEDSWNPAINIVDRFPIPKEWPRYLSCDFGFTHPFVCLWAAIDPDGRIYIYRQIYKTRTLVEDHAKAIAIASGWFHLLPKDHEKYQNKPADWADPLPRDVICDHDAEDRATLERHLKLYTTPAKKTVSDGIQAFASRLRPAGDGKPRFMIMRDCLVERDQELADAKQPTCLEDEPESYIWDTRQGMKKGDQPVKESDHACLIAGTAVTTTRGNVPIEQIATGDYVLTRNGYKRVIAAGMTAENAEVYTVRFSNGAALTGTGNHPIYLKDKGYIALRALRYGDIIEDIKQYSEQYTERYPLCPSLQQKKWKLSSTKGWCLDAILSHRTGQIATITDQTQDTSWQASRLFTLKSGKMPMDLYQKVVTFITRTVIQAITHWTTWNVSHLKNMLNTMLRTCQKSSWSKSERTSNRYDTWPLHGTSQKRVERGIVLLALYRGIMQNTAATSVSSAAKSINPGYYKRSIAASAPTLVSQHGGVTLDLITKRAFVSSAAKNSFVINTLLRHSAQEHVKQGRVSLTLLRKQEPVQFVQEHSLQNRVASRNIAQEHAQVVVVSSISKNEALQPVYNLTVDNTVGEGEYFANGILVHNCDAARYLVAYHDLVPNTVSYLRDIWR